MKNEAYPEKLIEDYQVLMGAYPEHFKLREEVAEILSEYYSESKNYEIIEIGCGNGETTEFILKKSPNLKITAIDSDNKMVERMKLRLKKYVKKGQLVPVCQDIFTYIENVESSSIDGITSSWTIHNFTKDQRNKLLKEIYRVLKPNGLFVNMDKYVFDDLEKEKQSFEDAVNNLKKIPKKEISDEAIKHEDEDRHPDIIMKEKESTLEMKKIGFKDIIFHSRVGREIVMSCSK